MRISITIVLSIVATALAACAPPGKGGDNDRKSFGLEGKGGRKEGGAVRTARHADEIEVKVELGSKEAATPSTTLFELPWGSGKWMVGRREGDESAPEGAMSFAVTSSGLVYILDQVNLRVLELRSDGSPVAEMPIPSETIQDLAVWRDGATLLLLDRLVRSSITMMTGEGRIVGEHTVLGNGIPEGGGITAMFARGDGVWLEYDNARLVRVLDGALRPGDRKIVPGRMYDEAAGLFLGAGLRAPRGAAVWIAGAREGEQPVARALFSFDHEVPRIVTVGAGAGGEVTCVFHVLEFGGAEFEKVLFEEVVGVRLDAKLGYKGMFRSPWRIRTWEQFKEFELGADGSVYQMAFTDEGVKIVRWEAK